VLLPVLGIGTAYGDVAAFGKLGVGGDVTDEDEYGYEKEGT
jgi:hypothetical protein